MNLNEVIENKRAIVEWLSLLQNEVRILKIAPHNLKIEFDEVDAQDSVYFTITDKLTGDEIDHIKCVYGQGVSTWSELLEPENREFDTLTAAVEALSIEVENERMKTREFDMELLESWGVKDMLWGDEDAKLCLEREVTGVDSDEIFVSVVFQAPDDKKLYAVDGEISPHASWASWDEKDSIEGIEMVPYEVKVTKYKKAR